VVVDNSGESPVLWFFYQGGVNNVEIGAIDLPSGTPRAESLDLLAWVPNATSALAGGLFRTDALPGGQNLLLALAQGTPDDGLVALSIATRRIFKDGFEESPAR